MGLAGTRAGAQRGNAPLKRNYSTACQYRRPAAHMSHRGLTSYSSFAMAAVGGGEGAVGGALECWR